LDKPEEGTTTTIIENDLIFGVVFLSTYLLFSEPALVVRKFLAKYQQKNALPGRHLTVLYIHN